ncbi:MFS transporter [Catenulispora sp. EB89]|uniref:MFS transporter n=1 Tax=Catenulispora sp. EB89 TaxID=3156257 RepID=UPI0035183982
MTANIAASDHEHAPLDAPAAGQTGQASRSRWGLLADRNFRLLWSGQTISNAGSSITTVALPLVAVTDLKAGPLAVGLLVAAIWLPWLVFGLPAGVCVGRIPRRALMVLCDLAMALVFITVPIAAACGACGIRRRFSPLLACRSALAADRGRGRIPLRRPRPLPPGHRLVRRRRQPRAHRLSVDRGPLSHSRPACPGRLGGPAGRSGSAGRDPRSLASCSSSSDP